MKVVWPTDSKHDDIHIPWPGGSRNPHIPPHKLLQTNRQDEA